MKNIKINAEVLSTNCASKNNVPVVIARLKIKWVAVSNNQGDTKYFGEKAPLPGGVLPYGEVMLFNSTDFSQHNDPGLKAMNLLEGEDVTIVISQADNSNVLCLEYITPSAHQVDKLKYLK